MCAKADASQPPRPARGVAGRGSLPVALAKPDEAVLFVLASNARPGKGAPSTHAPRDRVPASLARHSAFHFCALLWVLHCQPANLECLIALDRAGPVMDERRLGGQQQAEPRGNVCRSIVTETVSSALRVTLGGVTDATKTGLVSESLSRLVNS